MGSAEEMHYHDSSLLSVEYRLSVIAACVTRVHNGIAYGLASGESHDDVRERRCFASDRDADRLYQRSDDDQSASNPDIPDISVVFSETGAWVEMPTVGDSYYMGFRVPQAEWPITPEATRKMQDEVMQSLRDLVAKREGGSEKRKWEWKEEGGAASESSVTIGAVRILVFQTDDSIGTDDSKWGYRITWRSLILEHIQPFNTKRHAKNTARDAYELNRNDLDTLSRLV